jgi:micrococcal nuclease
MHYELNTRFSRRPMYTTLMSRQRLHWTLLALLLLICAGLALYQLGAVKPINPKSFLQADVGTYKIVSFSDGDTIVVDMQGKDEIVRFIGVDTPETHKPDSPIECYGPEASAYTKQRIGNDRVRLVADTLTTNRDRYDRLLRYVYLQDGTLLNQELVAKGYAFAYAFPFAKSNDFAKTMQAAKDSKQGLWTNCQPTQDASTGQWHSNPLVAS